MGMTCQVDTVLGAGCRRNATPQPDGFTHVFVDMGHGGNPPPDMSVPADPRCAGIDYSGACDSSRNTLKYCDNTGYHEYPCGDTYTCQYDTCSAGLNDCCPPNSMPAQKNNPECASIPPQGMCTADNVNRYCDGSGVLHEVPCGDFICQTDGCGAGDFSNCCSP
jgi:hypothetical protein